MVVGGVSWIGVEGRGGRREEGGGGGTWTRAEREVSAGEERGWSGCLSLIIIVFFY